MSWASGASIIATFRFGLPTFDLKGWEMNGVPLGWGTDPVAHYSLSPDDAMF